ncbi:MAG: amidohydrolase [Candidatus Tectimicrobiota bacterium]|nr:MAG: amidohydrolase [Candidatus Tectomicrobia bacterium]
MNAAPADLLLYGGRILTMDEAAPVQQAVAIRGGVIQAVGSDAELRHLAGSQTRLIDLRGHTVIPGLIDTHAHMDREGLKRLLPSLAGARSIAEVLARIRQEVAQKQPGEWVVTMPLGDPPNYADVPGCLAEQRYPTRWELDQVAPANPVYIKGIWTPWNVPPSVSIANSLALQRAGIDRHTRPPHPSVVIDRDAQGEPTGIFFDYNTYPVVEFTLMRVVPRFTHADRVQALRESMRLYNSVGTTTVYEGHGIAPEVLQAYRAVWDAGAMTVRSHLVLSPAWTSLRQAAEDLARWSALVSGYGFGDDMLRLCGVFLQLRGQRHVARLRSAALPFTGWAGFAETYNPAPRYRALLRLAAQHQVRVHTLAASLAELEEVLQAFEAVDAEFPLAPRRWVLEHVRDVLPSHLERMRRLGVVCETIPLTHLWLRGAAYLGDARRAARALPHQDFRRYGIPFALGTDNKPYNPFATLWAAVTRRERRSGQVLGPAQRLSRLQALRAFTLGGAYFCGQEARLGSLAPGKLADLAVLSDDVLRVPSERLPTLQAVLTLVGGRPVHDSGVLNGA